MAYLEDLSENTEFGGPESGVLNVGWLEKGQPFHTGETSDRFQTALNELCNDKSIHHYLGHHVCEFCPDASWRDPYFHEMGNGEIRVRDADGTWYVAPRLVIHYVEKHRYCPPEGFISAVLNPSEIGTDEMSEEIERVREPEKRMRELQGGPADAAEIDRILEGPAPDGRPNKPWWRFR
jgi:hypothetical protein